MRLKQTCPNVAFGGSFGFSNSGTFSPDMASGFWATGNTYKAEILHTASLIQFRASEFYSAQ